MKMQTLKQFGKRVWLTKKCKLIFVAALGVVLALVPLGARGQLGLDPCCAIISVGLNTISSLLTNVVAKPLSQIQQIQQQTANFEQQIIYPATAIANAKGASRQQTASPTLYDPADGPPSR